MFTLEEMLEAARKRWWKSMIDKMFGYTPEEIIAEIEKRQKVKNSPGASK